MKKQFTSACTFLIAAWFTPGAMATNTTPQALGEFRSAVTDNRCLDVHNAGTRDATNVKVWNCNGHNAQKWILTMDGEIRSGLRPDFCLDVAWGNAYNGANVQMYGCNQTPAQRWKLTPDGELVSALGNYCLDVSGADSRAGANIQVWQCNKSNAQKWSMAVVPWASIQSADYDRWCLGIADAPSGDDKPVTSQLCESGASAQKWFLSQDGKLHNAAAPNVCINDGFEFRPVYSGSRVITYAAVVKAIAGQCSTDTPRWNITADNQIRMAGTDECLQSDQNGSLVATCDDSKQTQHWALNSQLEVELRMVEGMAALAVRNGDTGHLTTDPVTILELLEVMNADVTKAGVIGAFSAEQYQYASDHYQTSDTVNWRTSPGTVGISRTVTARPFRIHDGMMVLINGDCDGEAQILSGNTNHLSYGQPYVDCEMGDNGGTFSTGVKLAEWGELDGPRASVVTDELATSFQFTPAEKGGFDIGGGYTLASVSGAVGDEDGSYAGISVGAGVGADGALKWGEDDQYGFRVSIRVVTIEAFVSREHVDVAIDWTETAANDVANWFEQAASDTAVWTIVAVNDTGNWFYNAGNDAAEWTSTAIDDAGDVFEDTGSFFEDVWNSFISWF